MMKKLDNENIIKRVYSSIKERVITCNFPPGERLNIEQLAELLRVSPTPVRESLNRLVAEELIVMVPRMGFFMKSLVESEIRDLYEVNQVLLDWSVCAVRKGHLKGGDVGFPEMSLIMEKLSQPQRLSPDYVVRYTSELFSHLASHSGNSEVDLRVRNINDRLHYIRLCECEMMENSAEQIAPLYRMYDGVCYEDLRHALRSYHEDRLSLLQSVLKARKYSPRVVGEEFGL